MTQCLKTVDPVSNMSHVSLAHPPALGTCFIAALGMLLQCVKKTSIEDLVLMRTKLLKWSSFGPHFTQKSSLSPLLCIIMLCDSAIDITLLKVRERQLVDSCRMGWLPSDTQENIAVNACMIIIVNKGISEYLSRLTFCLVLLALLSRNCCKYAVFERTLMKITTKSPQKL